MDVNLDLEFYRSSHLVVLTVLQVQYLFGGNPGDPADATKRLDDFWELHLVR